MKKKSSILMIAFVLLIQCFYGGLLLHANASEVISENILTGVALTVKDSNGNPVTDPVYEQGSNVTLDYTWALANNHGYKNGATFTFSLPVQFKLFNDIRGELKKDDGSSVGTFQVDAATHKVTMVFNEKIENDDVHGTLTFNTQFDKQTIQGSTEQQIFFSIKNGYTITLHFKPAVGSTIEKNGIPQGYNATGIQWSIDVNKTMDTVKNAVVTDTIPDGLSMGTPVTVAVYQLNVNLDGSVSKGNPVDGNKYEAALNAGVLSVKFKDETIRAAYRIEFSTAITDAGLSSFTNKAMFKGDNLQEVSSTSTVKVQRGSHLKKSSTGYDAKNQTISWAIQYNYDEKNILQANAWLTDQFDDSHELVPGSMVVYPITFDSSGKETLGAPLAAGTDYTWDSAAGAGKKGFTLNFTRDIASAYKVVYKTKSTDRVYDNGKITNTVTSAAYSDTVSQNINQMIVGKSRGTIDYQNKIVSWTIQINEDKYPMKNMMLTDIFTNSGLKLVPGSLIITSSSVSSSVYEVVYRESSPPAVTDGIVIKINKDTVTSDTYTVSYKTFFNNDWLAGGKTTFLNTARLDWDGRFKEVTASFDPNNATKNNGYKSGKYNAAAKQITWEIGVNYNGKEIANARVVDKLLKGQTLVPGTVKVYNMIIAPGGDSSRGAEVSPSAYTVSSSGNEITVQFNNALNSPYLIEFTTSLEGQLIEKTVANTANVYDGATPVSKDLTASVNIPNGGEYVYKDGQQSGDKMNWSIAINRGQSFVKDATITDTPSGNQILIPDSFHLYPTTVAAGGDVKKSNPELTKGTDYTLEIRMDDSGSQTFVLRFLKDIHTAYMLEYQSLIVANNGDHVTNTVGFSGTNVQTVITPTSKDIIVGVSSGSGTGSGTRWTLTVKKTDETDTATWLGGATFSLYRVSGPDRIFINSLTTGSNGIAEFKNLLSGNYVLKEVAAPAGYDLDSKEHAVTIKSTAGVVLNITNKKTVKIPETPNPETPTPETPTPGTPTPETPKPVIPNPDTPNPVTPTPEKPTQPITPGEPQEPANPPDEIVTKPQETPKSGRDDEEVPNADTPDNVVIGETLPKTGEESPLYIQIAGLSLILLGFALRKRLLKNEI